jgi:hypothetical protein
VDRNLPASEKCEFLDRILSAEASNNSDVGSPNVATAPPERLTGKVDAIVPDAAKGDADLRPVEGTRRNVDATCSEIRIWAVTPGVPYEVNPGAVATKWPE